jgi:hypothetical protein
MQFIDNYIFFPRFKETYENRINVSQSGIQGSKPI